MEIQQHNFGITGQPEIDYYNEFLGIGKKARQRRLARKAARVKKKQLQNEEREAQIARMKAETALIKQANKKPKRKSSKTSSQLPVQQAGFGSGAVIILGVLVVGGIVYKAISKKGAAVNVNPIQPT